MSVQVSEARELGRAVRLPVIETFGPTIQGEGPEAGRPCHFIRFGGCDYRCSWCDSMYAVEPAEVREHAEWLSVDEIAARVSGATLVVLSGGNPALFNLDMLLDRLLPMAEVSVETQGSRWKDWLLRVSRLVISPKPPSSGMATPQHEAETDRFMAKVHGLMAHVKIVIFDDADYEWAKAFYHRWSGFPLYLSVGTPQPAPGYEQGVTKFTPEPFRGMTSDDQLKIELCDRFAWLARKVADDPDMGRVKVLPQLHVLAFGTQRGV